MVVKGISDKVSRRPENRTKSGPGGSAFSHAMRSASGAAGAAGMSRSKSAGTTSTPKATKGSASASPGQTATPKRTFMTAAEAVRIYGNGTLEDLRARFKANMTFRIPQGTQKRP